MTKPIKTLFGMMKGVKIVTWLVMVIALVGMGVSGYLHYNNQKTVKVSSVKQANQNDTKTGGISVVGNSVNGNGVDNESYDKY